MQHYVNLPDMVRQNTGMNWIHLSRIYTPPYFPLEMHLSCSRSIENDILIIQRQIEELKKKKNSKELINKVTTDFIENLVNCIRENPSAMTNQSICSAVELLETIKNNVSKLFLLLGKELYPLFFCNLFRAIEH